MQRREIQPLHDAAELALVGGKALSLGNLMRNDYKTIDGFVVTTTAFNRMNRKLEEEVLKAFHALGVKYVAVRSSAVAEDGENAAWAGQLDTFLNIDRDNLIKAIQKSWSAISSERAKAYAKAKNIQAGKIAVIVQPMVQSDTAGVAFSCHPVTNNADQIVIEAGFGLGEAVVSGEITPDTYIVDKKLGQILQKHISDQTKQLTQSKDGSNEWQKLNHGNRQKLADAKIKELFRIVCKLEKIYGFAVDTEWLVKDNELFIMQVRPITTLLS
jgi:phosphoenolpyruvate synthase/pyruvate phosphate dikinase